jgi:hypothetical protein
VRLASGVPLGPQAAAQHNWPYPSYSTPSLRAGGGRARVRTRARMSRMPCVFPAPCPRRWAAAARLGGTPPRGDGPRCPLAGGAAPPTRRHGRLPRGGAAPPVGSRRRLPRGGAAPPVGSRTRSRMSRCGCGSGCVLRVASRPRSPRHRVRGCCLVAAGRPLVPRLTRLARRGCGSWKRGQGGTRPGPVVGLTLALRPV